MLTPWDEMNPDWEETHEARWEPWLDEEGPEFDDTLGGCGYCGAPEVRDVPEPFGGKPCCDGCFNMLIGDDRDAPPWRCGTGGA